MQQSALSVHEPRVGMQPPPAPPSVPGSGSGGSQLPLVQLVVQQSAPVVHAPAVGVHVVSQVFVVALHTPPQQSPLLAQVAPWPRHWVGGAMQRGGLKFTLSQRSFCGVAPQQPRCGPELQVSPVGRHVEFAASILHWWRTGSHTFEQHSASVAHVSDSRRQSLAVHTPPKQPSEQQS